MLANAKPSTTLFHAAQRGDLAAVQALLREHRAQVECERALRVSTRNGWHLVVPRLCAAVPCMQVYYFPAGGWYSGCCQHLFRLVNRAGNDQTAETLVKARGSSVRADLLLWHASFNGFTVTVKRLLSAKANVNARDGSGRTALHYACSSTLVKVLVRAKAHIEAIDHYHEHTALDRARFLLSTSDGLAKVRCIKTIHALQRAAEWVRKSRNPPSRLNTNSNSDYKF
jgi:ankyrin repeat protein